MRVLPSYTFTETVLEYEGTALYRALRSDDGAAFLVRVLTSEVPAPQEIARLRYDYAVARGLAVPGVLKAHSLERHGSSVALVMDEFPGIPLHDVIHGRRHPADVSNKKLKNKDENKRESKKIDLEATLRIALSIADTLESIHQHHVIHKNIQPRTVLVREDTLETRLFDWSVAAQLTSELQKPAEPGSLEGSLVYMSPEQTGRMNRTLDHRSDLYSLGVTMYEMLTGVLPFQGEDPMELVHSHIARIPEPPRALDPDIPAIVSAIVVKLMAKAAEDRYQRASGLRVDLQKCLDELRATGDVAPFLLGQGDYSGELSIPQHLYGRGAEIEALVAAFERASAGAAELSLVRGYPGIGKSALIHEVHKAIAGRRRGYFASGKFDQHNRGTPYVGVAGAFRELVRQILAQPERAVARWRRDFLEALGQSGQVLIDLVPELELCIGPQPSVKELGPTESQNRFNLIVQSFVRVLATEQHPLVLFFDDLQWADPASIKLLQGLLSSPDTAFLLVIGAYRDNEVIAAHPLTLAIDELERAGEAIHKISLGPLSPAEVSLYLADALRCEKERAAPLAALLHGRTHGNPFYLGQLLATIHEEGLLAWSRSSCAWDWDLAQIRERAVAENVVEFMVDKLKKMSPQAQRALSIAACIGDQFDLKSVSLLREKSLFAAASELWEALRAGLVVPTSSSYRFVHSYAAGDDDEPPSSDVQNPMYKFLHDRVQQAAYSLLPDGEDQRIHLQIGRLMASGALRSIKSDEVFEIARHMNAGAALISDEAERDALAGQNLAAGKRAKAATAYQAASHYLKVGMSLLGERARERDARLAFELSIELSECEYLSGLFGEAERLFEDVFSQATSDLDRARVYDLRMVLYITQGRVAEAVRVGRAALAMFGAPLPETEPEQRAMLEDELAEAQASLSGRPIGDLIDAAKMTDPTKMALLRILTSLDAPAYQTSPALHALVVLKKVNLSLRYGHSELSAFAYMTYGWLLSSSMGRYVEGYEFGEVALKLNELFKGTELTCKLNGIFGSFTHYVKPLRSRIEYLRRAYRAGFESGDFPYLSYNCFHTVLLRLGLGDELTLVREEIDKFLAFMRRTRDAPSTAVLTLARQVVLSLEGRTRDRETLSDGAFDEEAFVSSVRSPEFIACAYYTLKAWLLYLYGLHNEALSAVLMADERAASAGGFYYTTELAFFACLVALAPGEDERRAAAHGEDERRGALLDKYAPKLAEWTLRCPPNYEHMHKLVSAELARASGQDLLASQLYDEAARLAGENGFPHHQALANELAARFYLHLGRERVARAYLAEAYAGYQAWGARAKLEELGEEFGDLAVPREVKGHAGESLIDAMTVMKACQAISEEIDEEQLLQRLMTVVIESAGAERGCLLVESGDGLCTIAEGRVESGRIEVARTDAEGPSAPVPASIVSFVRRTKERVVIDDAAADARFSEDPVVAELRPKSILCIPLLRQAVLSGVLYLENNLVTAAFSHGQLGALELLSSQAAISLDNARLYAELRRENAERRRTEAELVEQLEVIKRQRKAIRVLSTPIIEVWDGVLTIPLLGALDAERAASMITSVLEALSRKRYQCVIVDLTGVDSIDAATGEHVARLIGAVRLLGTQGVVAGIRPDVALSIIASGVDLPKVATLANLREALRFYLRSSRGGARPRAS